MATNFGGVHVGCHCWVPLLGAIAGVPVLGARYQLWRSSRWVPLLGAIAGVPLLGAIARVPLLGCHCWVHATNFGGVHVGCHCCVRCRGVIAGCHCWGAIAGCHCWGPFAEQLREKIDQSVTPFSAAPFSTLITHKLVCAIWGLCWYTVILCVP